LESSGIGGLVNGFANSPTHPLANFVEGRHERHHFDGLHRVQASQLQHDEEQEEDDRAARDEQVLPVLPEAHVSQRVEVIFELF
jgi:hypothetical protein